MKKHEKSAIVEQFRACFSRLAADLGPAGLEILLDDASVQDIAPGRTLIRDRMPVDFIYFVLEGALGVYVEMAGKSARLGTVGPGEWLGEISVLSGELLASATIVADTTSRLVKVHHKTLDSLITGNEAVAKALLDHFIALMAQRLRAPLAQA